MCSVCHQAYSGWEQRPGLPQFATHLLCNATQQLMRTFVLLVYLGVFEAAAMGPKAQPPVEMPMPLRVCALLGCFVVAAHKTVLLTVSFPVNRPAPQSRLALLFYEPNYKVLALHSAEAFGAVVYEILRALYYRNMPCRIFLPFLALAAIPLAKVAHGMRPSLHCFHALALALATILAAPFLLVWVVAGLIYRNPRHVVHPLDAWPHLASAVAMFPLCWAFSSNIPVLVLLIVHCSLLLVGLAELLLVGRWRWRAGVAWVVALQFTALAFLFSSSLCAFPIGLGAPKYGETVVVCVAALWLGLLSGLAIGVNRPLIHRYFRIWQQRHGTFTLRVPPRQPGAPQVQQPLESRV